MKFEKKFAVARGCREVNGDASNGEKENNSIKKKKKKESKWTRCIVDDGVEAIATGSRG